MQDQQQMMDEGQAEIERVRRQVIAMHERIRAITPVDYEVVTTTR